MPKYAALIYAEEQENIDPDEMRQTISDYVEFGQKAADVLLGGEALEPTSAATTVHVEGGKGGTPVYTDGPVAETEEALGGFYLIEADNLDGALEWARQIPGAWLGRVEVRPVVKFDDQGNPG